MGVVTVVGFGSDDNIETVYDVVYVENTAEFVRTEGDGVPLLDSNS